MVSKDGCLEREVVSPQTGGGFTETRSTNSGVRRRCLDCLGRLWPHSPPCYLTWTRMGILPFFNSFVREKIDYFVCIRE